MVEFKNKDVAAKYVSLREKDGRVHVPSGKSVPGVPGAGFAGPLSLITLAAADKAFASGSNILKLKSEAPVPETKPSNNGQVKEKEKKKDLPAGAGETPT